MAAAADRAPAAACHVVVATRGRVAEVAVLLDRLGEQSLAPTRVLVVGAEAGDLPMVASGGSAVSTLVSPRAGSSAQRNVGLERLAADGALEDEGALVCFFDDDFRPAAGWLEAAAAAFADGDLLGASGVLLADGADGPGVSEAEAERLLADDDGTARWDVRAALYGCNMAVRATALKRHRFDEALPLYGWMEDHDLGVRLAREGRVGVVEACRGVHLGTKRGRTSGRRLGYSQVANAVYLSRKGNLPDQRLWRRLARAVAVNAGRAVRPGQPVDYRGRLLGNAAALRDLAAGTIRPDRILSMR